MEDTKSLLVMVLHKIFRDRPKIVDDTYQLIYNYNNGKREKNGYEKVESPKTLKNICDIMNDELPPEILVYLLTLVDMPQEDGQQLPIMEKIQRTYSCLAESVRPSLLEYLSCKRADGKTNSKQKSNIEVSEDNHLEATALAVTEVPTSLEQPQVSEHCTSKFVKPTMKRNKNKRKIIKNSTSKNRNDNCDRVKSLLDLTADYVIKNEQNLKLFYKAKLAKAWKMINSNCYFAESLKQCYNTVEDINKKAKLLRCIENDNITEDIFMEEYGNSEILLKESSMYHVLKRDPFIVGNKLLCYMKNIVGDNN